VGFPLLPITVGIAVLRYRLYEIDFVIQRALVFSALTASTIAVYVFTVGYLGTILHAQDSRMISLVATGIVAVLFQPLREGLQRLVNRLMYGDRDDPYVVLSRLGQRLEAALTPELVLPAIVQTVKDALNLPYAAIAVREAEGAELTVATAAGTPATESVTLPLMAQNEPVGELTLGLRPGEDVFATADRRLLHDLTRQAGLAIHAVRLNLELQRARERLVNAREEERLRIRRDLHDGLGSALAALHLQAGQIRTLIQANPEAAEALVIEWRSALRSAIADIRRLVYDLRPPALDELGLVDALRSLADQYSATTAILVTVEAPERLPALPAAVEVAAFRIVEEALANIVHHAWASDCTIQLALADGLSIDICDDGIGLPAVRKSGVGLHSMHTRSAELGGTFLIEPMPMGGTHISAWLPLRPDHREKTWNQPLS
jgi:signal transduction histidine kinase